MEIRDLYHGTTGDNILEIIRFGLLRPNADGRIYFSEWRFDSVLMHGADLKRGRSFAVKLRVTIPTEATITRDATPGVLDTLVVTTPASLRTQVLELYVRAPRAISIDTIKGMAEIQRFLSA